MKMIVEKFKFFLVTYYFPYSLLKSEKHHQYQNEKTK